MKTNVDGHAPEFRHFGDRDAAASCGVVLCSDRCSGFRPGLRVWVVPDVPGVSTGVLAADGKFRNARGCVSGDGAMKKMTTTTTTNCTDRQRDVLEMLKAPCACARPSDTYTRR